jgi:hypothetical protein
MENINGVNMLFIENDNGTLGSIISGEYTGNLSDY